MGASTTDIIDTILSALVIDESIDSKESFHRLKNSILGQYAVATGPTHIELIDRFQYLVSSGTLPDSLRVRKVLRKRAVRSLSGVSVISLLTKFWGCPGKCIYCPSYEGLPKSYIPDEPAVQRAEMNQFDPFLQVQNRLRSLQITGNAISKCDVRIIGGTWSVYPQEYQEDFIRNIYDAHSTFGSTQYTGHSTQIVSGNPFSNTGGLPHNEHALSTTHQVPSTTLEEAKHRNETAESRVIGMAIETRPDWVTPEEIMRLRRYGVTRVEIGYQTTHDTINTLNKRGHGNRESIRATRLLKDAGFKVVAHMMPGLYGSTPDLDRTAMSEIFSNSDYRPDELKIYPLVVTPHSELEDLWRRGEFTPYDDTTLIPLMAELQGMIPEYVRLNRMYRDIPAHEILAGSKIANLRQITELQMKKMGIIRHDISAREVRANPEDIREAELETYFYEASGGHEWFIQMVHPAKRTLYGLARLRIPSQVFTGQSHDIPVLEGAAIIREVHVFGDQVPVGGPPIDPSALRAPSRKQEGSEAWEGSEVSTLVGGYSKGRGVSEGQGGGQHQGIGKKMLQKCEEIIQKSYKNIHRVAVISGVGARGYYKKLGYSLQDEYMVKILTK